MKFPSKKAIIIFSSIIIIIVGLFALNEIFGAFTIIPRGTDINLQEGLVGWWTLDGTDINWSTNTTQDRSPMGNNGTLMNMSTTTSPVLGKVGQALKFTGQSNEYINIPHHSSLNISGAFTLKSWINNPSPWLSGWDYRTKITIDNTKIDSDLTDFPVFVKLTSANFDFSKARSDGYDIRFTSSDGTTLLKYDRERHDSVNGKAEYHVKVPSVASSTDTEIYIYYGKSDASDGEDKANTWDANVVFRSDMADKTTSTINDSVSTTDPTKKGANEPIQTDGKIGKAQDFDGTNDYIDFNQVSSGAIPYAFGFWIYLENGITTSNVQRGVFSADGASTDYKNLVFGNVSSLTTNGTMEMWSKLDGQTVYPRTYIRSTFSAGWHHIFFSWDSVGEKYKIYVDSAEQTTYANDSTGRHVAASEWDLQDLWVGRDYANNYPKMIMDELRISNTARSAAWIKAEYNSGNNSLLSLGDEEGVIAGKGRDSYQLEISGSTVKGYINGYEAVSAQINPSSWNFAVLSYDQSNLKLYINGTEQDSYATTTAITTNSDPLKIGSSAFALIDDVRIYNRTLSTSEIKALYQNPTGSKVRLASGSNDMVTDGLVGLWSFDGADMDFSTNTAFDRSGNGNHGTLMNMSTTTSPVVGVIGQALKFDGVNQNSNMGDVLDMGLNDWTISAWIKKDSIPPASQYWIGKSKAAKQNYRYALAVGTNGGVRAFIQGDGGDDVGFNGDILVTGGKWHFATVVYKRNGNASIYVDGVFDKSQSISHWETANMQSNNPFRIGCYTASDNVTPSNCFEGFLDDVRIYNRALSEDEIKRLYTMSRKSVIIKPWLEGWSYRTKITIDNTKIDEDLTDFPVLVKLTNANFDFSKARSDGYDIRFTSSDGTTELKYDRERHDSVNELAEYHVKVPSIASSTDTEIYIYYGKADATDGEDKANTWDSNFVARYDMTDTSTSTISDSTSNDYHGTKKGANEPIQADSKIGKAQDFDGSDDRIGLGNPANLNFDGIKPFSISALIKPDAIGASRMIFARFNGGVLGHYYLIMTSSGVIGLLREVYPWTVNGTTVMEAGNWYHVVGTYDGTAMRVYLNGSLDGGPTNSGSVANNSLNVYIGCRLNGGSPDLFFDGLLDEVRISNTARSAAWIKAEYNSGNNSLLSLGGEERR
jgi:hypothetical protein